MTMTELTMGKLRMIYASKLSQLWDEIPVYRVKMSILVFHDTLLPKVRGLDDTRKGASTERAQSERARERERVREREGQRAAENIAHDFLNPQFFFQGCIVYLANHTAVIKG